MGLGRRAFSIYSNWRAVNPRYGRFVQPRSQLIRRMAEDKFLNAVNPFMKRITPRMRAALISRRVSPYRLNPPLTGKKRYGAKKRSSMRKNWAPKRHYSYR